MVDLTETFFNEGDGLITGGEQGVIKTGGSYGFDVVGEYWGLLDHVRGVELAGHVE